MANVGGRREEFLRWADEEIEKSKRKEATKMSSSPEELNGRMDALEGRQRRDRLALAQERDTRVASEVDARATELMKGDPGLDHGTATRMALAEDGRFGASAEASPRRLGEATPYPEDEMREAVESRMAADPENYGGAAVGAGSEDRRSVREAELKEAMKERGYDVD